MELRHEFEIDRPIEQVWERLLDLRNVARSLPGAAIDDVESDGTHHGTLRMKLGSFTASFRGTARYTEIDHEAHRVLLSAQGNSTQGQAGIELDGRALPGVGPGTTRVELASRVVLSGRIANFGAALASDVARQVLDQFVANLTASFEDGAAAPTGVHRPTTPGAGDRAPAGTPPAAEALDLGSVLTPAWLTRPVSLPVALGLAVVAFLLGRSLRRAAAPAVTVVLPPSSEARTS